MLLNSNYRERDILCSMGVEYKKIRACPDEYILCINEFATLRVFSTCWLSQFKKKPDASSGEEDT